MIKIIKSSKRGLTFSFNADKKSKFNIGERYNYIVDIKSNKIYLVASAQNGKLKVSRKNCRTIKSLIDLRSKRVIDTINNSDFLKVIIKRNTIVVESYKADNRLINNNCSNNENITYKSYKVKKTGAFLLKKKLLVANGYNYASTDTEIVCQIVSLFSGCGMLDKAFTGSTCVGNVKYTFDIKFALEKDEGAVKTYKNNIGDCIRQGDITTFPKSKIPKADLLLAGVPCRPFSNANRMKRLDKHGENRLLYDTIDIINENDYSMFAIENVPQLLTADNGLYLKFIEDNLSSYNIQSHVFQDSEFGGYTKRRRAFIIGSKIGSVDFSKVKKQKPGTVREALSKVDSSWYNYNDVTSSSLDVIRRMSFVPMGGNWRNIPEEFRTQQMKANKKQANSYYRLSLDSQACTLTNYRKPPIIHPLENRTLTVAEAIALSGFDKDFILKGTLFQKQQYVGNGVPMALGKVLRSLIEQLIKENKFAY